MYCRNCGGEIIPGAVFCPNCGGRVAPDANGGAYYSGAASGAGTDTNKYTELSAKLRSSSVYWLVIGIIQVVSPAIFIGIWNLVQSRKRKQLAEVIEKQRPRGLCAVFEASKGRLIFFFVLNLLFGAILGIIGVLYDFHVRRFVLDNRQTFG
ncbi:MAG: zinc ribbon domain-containing protein [Clostridia bacterium]|nr:zinc ribbon domain-containing protein [Clostridia bacterium]MBR5942616.1 zinc ribbon domain-containing protein [Clostridia bacterium]